MIDNKLSLPSVKCVVCVSEGLHLHQLADMKRAFSGKVISRYSNEEVGIVAHQRDTGGPYLVDRSGVIVEVLDMESQKSVLPGEEGSIIITDLNADLFPVIRYNTGDRAIVGEYRDGQLYSLSKVIGREAEILFSTNGRPISSLSIGPGIYKPLSQKNYTVTFQFSQIGKKSYELRFKTDGAEIEQEVLDEININLLEILGSDALTEVKYVKELFKRKSGKVPIYVNEQAAAK